MAYTLRKISGNATISTDGLTVTNQSAVKIGTTIPIEKNKYYFEITFATAGYKNLTFNVGNLDTGLRVIGTVGIDVDHTKKTIKYYLNNILQKTWTYTISAIPQLEIYMNEHSVTTFNFGATPFKYQSPLGFPSVESMGEFFLIKDGQNIMTFDNDWVLLNSTDSYNENLFITRGIKDNLSILHTGRLVNGVITKPIDELSNKFNIIYYSDISNISNVTVKLNLLNTSQVIMGKGDINLLSVESINKFTMNSTILNNGKIRYLVSNDSGITWFTFDGIKFNPIGINSIAVAGMSTIVINSIPSLNWNELLVNNKVRFAYYIEGNNPIDNVLVDDLTIDCVFKGEWESQVMNKDYSYHYVNETRLMIKLLSNGNYKINYFRPISIKKDSNTEEIYIWEEFSL